MAIKFKRRKPEDFDFSRAPVYRKSATLRKSQVKIADRRQEVVTRLGGIEETRNIARAGDRIVTGPRGERYVIPRAKFSSLYEEDAIKPGRYRSKARVRALVLEENTEMKAPWGEMQRALKGGMVVRRVGKPADMYLIDQKSFAQTYVLERPAPKRRRDG